jgi:hypothetical protein
MAKTSRATVLREGIDRRERAELSGTVRGDVQHFAGRFDPFHDPYLADPYPFFAEARATNPVFYSPDLDYWVVTRYHTGSAFGGRMVAGGLGLDGDRVPHDGYPVPGDRHAAPHAGRGAHLHHVYGGSVGIPRVILPFLLAAKRRPHSPRRWRRHDEYGLLIDFSFGSPLGFFFEQFLRHREPLDLRVLAGK